MKLFFMLVFSHNDINEVLICMEIHERYESVHGVWHHTRENYDGPLQFHIVCMEYCVRFPLFSHIARVPERGELHNEWFEWLNV
jgi:hypothetical protein